MHERFRRTVLPGEHMWLAMDIIYPPFVNQMVLEGTGTLDFNELHDAVARASEANPGCRLILKGALSGRCWIDSGMAPPVRRVNGALWDGFSQDNAPFLKDRLPCHGPTCEVLLVEGSPKQRLIFRSNHGVMDGGGSMIWAEDVFRALRGEELLGSRSSLTKLDIITSITDSSKGSDGVKCIAPTGKYRPNTPGAQWRRLSFTGQFHKLLGKVAWAIAQSAWQYSDGHVRFIVSLDRRPSKPGLRLTSNFNAGISVDVTKASTPDSIKQDILSQLENKNYLMRKKVVYLLDKIPLKVLGIGIKTIAKNNHVHGRYDLTAVISNLGVTDTTKFSSSGFHTDTVFFIPPYTDLMPAFLTLTGCKDREEICITMPNSLGSENRMERLLHDICQALAPDAVQGVVSPQPDL
jgi:hypothetical protein